MWSSHRGDMKSMIFCVVTQFKSVEVHWCLKETHRFHFQGWKVSQARNKNEVGGKQRKPLVPTTRHCNLEDCTLCTVLYETAVFLRHRTHASPTVSQNWFRTTGLMERNNHTWKVSPAVNQKKFSAVNLNREKSSHLVTFTGCESETIQNRWFK
jgi:hypothetical protein